MLASKPGRIIFNQEQGLFFEGAFLLISYFILLCYTSRSTCFERGNSMKIHKTVNPVAYENTYYLEEDQHLMVVDPGSSW